MTREEFTQTYATRGGLSVEDLERLGFEAAPCDCGDELCQGWQMLPPAAAQRQRDADSSAASSAASDRTSDP